MAKRTEILCIHEGKKGSSVDPVFINRLIKSLKPSWIRPIGSNSVRLEACGGRTELMEKMPEHLKTCIEAGGDVTLMVWADVDKDADPEALKEKFWVKAKAAGLTREQFDLVVFAFARYRIENWIQFLTSGVTVESDRDEDRGPRVIDKVASDAARKLAERCQKQKVTPKLPASLEWSCKNWKALSLRMKTP
jgi:hypothetical protein